MTGTRICTVRTNFQQRETHNVIEILWVLARAADLCRDHPFNIGTLFQLCSQPWCVCFCIQVQTLGRWSQQHVWWIGHCVSGSYQRQRWEGIHHRGQCQQLVRLARNNLLVRIWLHAVTSSIWAAHGQKRVPSELVTTFSISVSFCLECRKTDPACSRHRVLIYPANFCVLGEWLLGGTVGRVSGRRQETDRWSCAAKNGTLLQTNTDNQVREESCPVNILA